MLRVLPLAFALVYPVTLSAQVAVQAPAEVQAGQQVTVRYSGPSNARDFITIVAKGSPEGRYGDYKYARDGRPVELRAPETAGDYEIRYLASASPYPTLARSPLKVTAVSATLRPPARVAAGAKLVVPWEGPNNKQDFITLVKKGTPEKKYSHYVYTERGSPATLTAPDEPGEYEVRYLTGKTYLTLGSAPVTVGGVSASLQGPAAVEGGQPFTVKWTGPGNAQDWISVAPKGGSARDYEHYAYTTSGNPVTIKAPLTPGDYEIRYQTGQSYTILAAQPIRVGPPKSVPGKLRVVSGSADGRVGLAPTTAVEVILDASGSMLQRVGGKRRIDIARQVLTELVEKTIPAGTPLALRVFGHKQAGTCQTDLEQALAPLDPVRTAAWIAKVQATNEAKTPIAKSLAAVAQDLGSARGERLVVLVTDGEETCGGDPAAEIERLRAAGTDLRVNIVGFAIADQALKDTFRNWAQLGGGRFLDAGTEKELGAALVEAVRVPVEAVNTQGQVIANGFVDGAAMELPAGQYTVQTVGSAPRTIGQATVKPGEMAVTTMKR
jgi:hypothetical protein